MKCHWICHILFHFPEYQLQTFLKTLLESYWYWVSSAKIFDCSVKTISDLIYEPKIVLKKAANTNKSKAKKRKTKLIYWMNSKLEIKIRKQRQHVGHFRDVFGIVWKIYDGTSWQNSLWLWVVNHIYKSVPSNILVLHTSLSFIDKKLPSRHLQVQSQQQKYKNNVWNLFKAGSKNSKNTWTTSMKLFRCLYC